MKLVKERYIARWRRAQDLMRQQGLDLLLVAPGSDLFYLLGGRGHISERMTLLVLQRDGRPGLLIGALEATAFQAWSGEVDLHVWRDHESPTAMLERAIAPAGIRTIGVSEQLWSIFLLRLQATYGAARWSSAGAVLRELRIVKDADELAIMREASRRTDMVWERFVREPLVGLTERQAATRLTALLAEQGMPPSFETIVASGPHGASPHHEPGERVIQAGDALVCDFGGLLEGYCSDITRTAHVGPPDDEFRSVYALVQQAQEAAFRSIHPGQPCEAVDAAAREVIEAAGHGQHFIHRTGHGLGIDIHEEPYIVAGNAQPLATGMVFSDEPGVYLPGRFGVRIEDIVVVTEAGAERLNNCSRDLAVVG
jgi:Xaa-Pro aminopeptidase